MIDLDEVDVDDDGDVVGLDDQVDSIKEDYPELFRPAEQQRKRATKLDASNRQGGGTDKPKTNRREDRCCRAVREVDPSPPRHQDQDPAAALGPAPGPVAAKRGSLSSDRRGGRASRGLSRRAMRPYDVARESG
jgi:hypothetical protein